MMTVLVVLTIAAATVMYQHPEVFTATLLMIPVLLADVLLSPRRVTPFILFLCTVLVVETLMEFGLTVPASRWVTLLVIGVMSLVVLVTAWQRGRLGVRGVTGDSMLLDLKDRISRHGEMPELPQGWLVDVATRSAGDTSFAGDFMVTHRSGSDLSIVLVDVSGKGVDAGTRSLLLSGAFGGLLGAVTSEEFLPKANEFLNRQAWDEGFATAIQLSLDLGTGAYEIRVAGHPPAIQFRAGSGLWHLHDEVHGPILGVTSLPDFPAMAGRLGQGDALLFYTDGLVERPGRDIGLGIDKLIGEAERLVRYGFGGSAQWLVDRLGAANDDCALIVLQRQ